MLDFCDVVVFGNVISLFKCDNMASSAMSSTEKYNHIIIEKNINLCYKIIFLVVKEFLCRLLGQIYLIIVCYQ